MGKKEAAAANIAKQSCACGRHATGEKEACRFCPRVVCDSCREEYCCGPICEKCNEDREHLMQCDKCEAPVCSKCIVISKGQREGNMCKSCKTKAPAQAADPQHASHIAVS
ncbi:hypothetical protein EMPS_02824 [Entomortierella parvispora]|uniref:Uncharacterized protein n=1 Tax=Entomortierella parvispora TaxID=205924 RepID=A0A9P3H5P6_9FUNG|nr:hypothetical protein EMPS_02824 [Entomortierella parvispora]